MSDTKGPTTPTVDFAELLAAYREGQAVIARQAREEQREVEEAASRVLDLLPGRLRAGMVAEGVVSVAASSYGNGLLLAEPADVARELNRRMGLTTGWVGDAALPGVWIPSKALVAVLEAQAGRYYVVGLPPERLRKVCSKWDVQERGGPADLPLEFSQDGRLCKWADGKEWFAVIETSAIWDGRTFRPHGATWARVEAMAAELEGD